MVTKTPKSVTKPDAWIVVNNQKDKSKPSDRGRKSIKNGKVYLDDKQEFQIELYNPLTECVLCDVKLNGQSISQSGLVLKPAQRFYLDCFIDDKKKFIFNTYEVEDTQESTDSTKNNGLLEVFFYKESVVTINDWKRKFDRVIVEKWYPVYYPQYYPIYPYHQPYYPSYPYHQPYYPSYPYHQPYYPSYPYDGNVFVGGCYSGNINTNIGTTTTSGLGINNVNTSNTQNLFTSNNSVMYGSSGLASNDESSLRNLNSIETGRVEKGSSSSQKFTEIDMDFESNFITSTIIQLLPSSRRPVETIDISKMSLKEAYKTVKNKLDEVKSDTYAGSDEVIELIKKLSDLHSAGILTDDEFKTKKAKLLSKI
jgi:hypothetical protein